MKKVVFAIAIALSGLTSFAAVSTPVAIVAVQDYKEIKVSDVPAAVAEAVKKQGGTIDKAFTNGEDYKLEVTTGDAKSTVYYKADGTAVAK